MRCRYPPLEGGSKSAKQISGRGQAELLQNLGRYGYGIPPDVDVPPEKIIAAFQRHFRPSCIDGVADAQCAALLEQLLSA